MMVDFKNKQISKWMNERQRMRVHVRRSRPCTLEQRVRDENVTYRDLPLNSFICGI